MSQFKPADYARFNETKLRGIKQVLEESTKEYYYDVMNLCRKVDPRMTDATKLYYLYRGLHPRVLERFWRSRFLGEVKLYGELTSFARQE